MTGNKYDISHFICCGCGNSFPLPRPKSKRRERGHVKDLWCPFCKQKAKTIEIRSKDVFKTMSGQVIY